jgi:hypothetical protein
MTHTANVSRPTNRVRFLQAVRRSVEYGAAVGIALLCSYWILQGRW